MYHKFFLENLDLFNLVWIENDTIFSHAGISEGWAKRVWDSLNRKEDFNSVMEIAVMLQYTPLKEFEGVSLISDISRYRGGDMFYGSCEWADIREHIAEITSYEKGEFIGKGEEGLFQVFGHTQLRKPLSCDKWICLDCRKGFIIDSVTHNYES